MPRNCVIILTLFLSCTCYATDEVEPARAKYFLTACAMVHNEMSIVLEWVEFHRIQGVDHFVFLDDESSDDIYLLPRLYASLGYPDLVEVIPQNFRKRQQDNNYSYRDYIDGQMQAMNLCNTRLAGVSEWLLVHDVDEFMFSPNYHTIANFLRNVTNNKDNEYCVQSVRFGTNGVQNENRVRLSLDPFANRITILIDVFNENLLITSRNNRRALFPGLEEEYETRFNVTCAPPRNPGHCQHANGKSIWRPDKCATAGVHWCEVGLKGRTWPALDDLRINHYAFRSKEHIESIVQNQRNIMGLIKNGIYRELDKIWFSVVEDNSMEPYYHETMSRMRDFPSVTIYHRKLVNAEWIASYFATDLRGILNQLAFSFQMSTHLPGFFIGLSLALLGILLILHMVRKETRK